MCDVGSDIELTWVRFIKSKPRLASSYLPLFMNEFQVSTFYMLSACVYDRQPRRPVRRLTRSTSVSDSRTKISGSEMKLGSCLLYASSRYTSLRCEYERINTSKCHIYQKIESTDPQLLDILLKSESLLGTEYHMSTGLSE